MSSELKELERQRHEINTRISQLESERDGKKSARQVGRFYKYLNSGGGCDERWWLYFKVTGSDGRWVSGFQFQRLPNGRCDTDAEALRHFVLNGYEEISRDEYDAAWAEFRRLLDLDADRIDAKVTDQ